MQEAVTWEYQKDGFTSYMITKQLEHTEEYECRMIEEDSSLCLLPCHSKEGKLWFEIQDHMTLEEGLYRTRSQGRYLREVFEKLLHVLEQFEGTLLREDSIYLSKETVFLDAKEQLSLCYLSGYEGNIREQIVRLVEYLMKKIDHKDQEAVVFVYGLYPVVQEQNFSLERVKEFLQEQAAVRMEMPQTQSVFLAEQENITESQKLENPVKQRNEKEEKTCSPKEYVAQKKKYHYRMGAIGCGTGAALLVLDVCYQMQVYGGSGQYFLTGLFVPAAAIVILVAGMIFLLHRAK